MLTINDVSGHTSLGRRLLRFFSISNEYLINKSLLPFVLNEAHIFYIKQSYLKLK